MARLDMWSASQAARSWLEAVERRLLALRQEMEILLSRGEFDS